MAVSCKNCGRRLSPLEICNCGGDMPGCDQKCCPEEMPGPLQHVLEREENRARILQQAARAQVDAKLEIAAVKHDSGKPPMSLLPGAALRKIAEVLDFGQQKYSSNNWRKGFKWSRLHDACLRHLTSYQDGERLDPESNLSHLAHAGCMLLFLLQHEVEGLGEDDMYKGEEK